MMHKMRLANEYFEKIKSGIKTIECRLYDEKRRQLKIGDIIEFTDAQNDQRRISAEIVALHKASSFSELLDQFPIAMFGGENKDQLLAALKQFYSHEEEKGFGVIGIEIRNIQR